MLAISSAKCCNEDCHDQLRRNAIWLISTLPYIPDDEQIINFVETYQVTHLLFEIAVDANRFDSFNVALKIQALLLTLSFRAGKYTTSWSVLTEGCSALACLNILPGLDNAVLLNDIQTTISKTDYKLKPSNQNRVLGKLDEKSNEHYSEGYNWWATLIRTFLFSSLS